MRKSRGARADHGDEDPARGRGGGPSAGGEEGHVINTSSGDGGVSPLPYQSVYASSKAAVSCISECLAAQLQSEGTKLAASVFYPSGGLLDTGIWTTDRNRPEDLAREQPYDPVPTVEDFKVAAEAAGEAAQLGDKIRSLENKISVGTVKSNRS